jgi:hypothetical protein
MPPFSEKQYILIFAIMQHFLKRFGLVSGSGMGDNGQWIYNVAIGDYD